MATPNEKAGLTVTTTIANGKSLSTTATSAETLAPSAAASLAPSPDLGPRRSSDVSTPATAHNDLNPFDTDLEAMVSGRTIAVGGDDCGMKSVSCSNLKGSPDGQVWPGQAHWKKKAKAAKINQRSCQLFARMSKRNRIIIKVLIGALLVGIAVGVGLGVSKSLGVGVWKPDGN